MTGSRERKIVDDVIAVLSDLHRFKMEKNSDEKFQRFFFYLKESALHEAPRATYGAGKVHLLQMTFLTKTQIKLEDKQVHSRMM
jgi:hypothetical protein